MTDTKKATPKSSPKTSHDNLNTAIDVMGEMYRTIRNAVFITTETDGQNLTLMKYCEGFELFAQHGETLNDDDFNNALRALARLWEQINNDILNQRITITMMEVRP